MIAHIIHDRSGAIRSIVFQGTEVPGTLQIKTEEKDELVTSLDLEEVFPEMGAEGQEEEATRHQLHLMAQEIRAGFRVDPKRKTLEKTT